MKTAVSFATSIHQKPTKYLNLGLGAASLPRFHSWRYSGEQVTELVCQIKESNGISIEKDSAVIELAKKYFKLNTIKNHRVILVVKAIEVIVSG